MKMFIVLAALILGMSGCTLFNGVTITAEEKNGKYVTTTTVYDLLKGEVVIVAECNKLSVHPANAEYQYRAYSECTVK